MGGTHALLSPSSASRWLNCPGSVALSKDQPDVTSLHALEGTAAHLLASYCLKDKNDAVKHIGKMYAVEEIDAYLIEEEMAQYVQVYLDYVRCEAHKKHLLIEQEIPLHAVTGEDESYGTADAVVIHKNTLEIIDLKYGMGVKVYAKENEQLMLYAAATAIEYGVFGDFTKFKIVIVQPRLDHIDEWEFDVKELGAFIARIREISPRALDGSGELNPSGDACRFCKAKAICPALAEQVKQLTSTGLENLDKLPEPDLSKSMSMAGMVEDWLQAVRAETERRLVSGIKVAGWKLVQGRMGSRQWLDAKAVEEAMTKKLKLSDDIVYKKSLVSPTQVEKILIKTDQASWNALQEYITQKEGAPSVAPSTDPRPELGAVVDSFDNLGEA